MKEPVNNSDIVLLQTAEQELRLRRLTTLMKEAGTDAILVHNNANIYYLTGRVFAGYMLVRRASGAPLYFVRRPNHLRGEGLHFIRKPEEIAGILSAAGIDPEGVALELDSLSHSAAMRLNAAIGRTTPPAGGNASVLLRRARAVKTEAEQQKLRESGARQTRVYSHIPGLYSQGMTDVGLQIEIEHESRLEGCLGQFRVAGDDMELYMGNVLTGDNADTPSPYDFAMGGAGADPSLPVGADGSAIRPGIPVMVDVNGNYTGYMTDMTRCYIAGSKVPAEVTRVNRLSADICRAIADAAHPGAKAAELYDIALGMARDAGMEEYFMGHRYHAGFVGHGVGIEVNELPVLAPRSRDIIEAGNVIAVEPKFVIPGLGAIGIENTYIVRSSGAAERITDAPEDIIPLQ